MPLNVYRRHLRNDKCVGGHPPDSRSYEADELRRTWKKCFCPIYVSGTLSDKFDRKSTGKVTWVDAKTEAARLQAANSWTEATPPLSVPPTPATIQIANPQLTTIQAATDAYLASRQGRSIAPSTLRKYRTLVRQVLAFAESRSYATLIQFTVSDMDQFYASWTDKVRARGKKLERLNGFFRFCITREWLSKNPARGLEPPIGAGTAANKHPFTDAELTRIYGACDRVRPVRWKNQHGSGECDGEDVKTMIMLLCWTGLRISDGATFNMSRVTPDPQGGASVFLRMTKTKGALSTWIPNWLYGRLAERQAAHGSRIFERGKSTRLETVTDLWRRQINRAFDLAGPYECGRPTPHIFRHTFVRLLLQRGVRPSDVADLIGDTEQMVVKHYAKWVPERQERLTSILREKLADAPKPKLIVIPGNRP